MVELRQGDILSTDAEALVNTVNCVGISGRGIALQFRKQHPDNFKAYEKACKRGEVQPGRMFVYETGSLTPPRYIINFPTKRHWRGASRIEDIEAGLKALAEEIRSRDIRSIAIPPLGCGLGGLNWEDVRPRIERMFAGLPQVSAVVFEPVGTPEISEHMSTTKVPNMTAGRAALIGLMRRYLAGLMDPFVTLLEIHKLMYLLQEAGEPLRLRYVKAPYGPYAENLRHVLSAIEGHFIVGFADGGDDPEKILDLVPGAAEDADNFLADHRGTRERFDRVADLVQGFETPFGLELLSTVHWVAKRENAVTRDLAIRNTHSWNEGKRRFLPEQIAIAWDTLQAKGWLAARPLAAS